MNNLEEFINSVRHSMSAPERVCVERALRMLVRVVVEDSKSDKCGDEIHSLGLSFRYFAKKFGLL